MKASMLVGGILAIAGIACDPGIGMYGTVRTASHACASPSDAPAPVPAPVVGAKVTVHCGKDSFPLADRTDANGRFFDLTVGSVDPSCILRVEKDGYTPRELRLADLCVGVDGKPGRRERGTCNGFAFIELDEIAKK